MKTNDKQIRTKAYGTLSEGKFGIAEGDQAHIFVILRNKLYSDKIMAVVREYSTNATDAHNYAGCSDTPIKVIVPSKILPAFKVRDFGMGLSEHQIYELYVKYGASTKRETNDAIGQLGLGCKSGFAYSDNFTITSFYEGIKSTYHAYIDESLVGVVKKMMEAPSDEPSGVEVSIPVLMKDVKEFSLKAAHCFRFFRIPPDCKVKPESNIYEHEGDGWKLGVYSSGRYDYKLGTYTKENKKPWAVMGDIGYPINPDLIPGLNEIQQSILKVPMELYFDIGDLSIAASREALEYTKHTIKSIRLKLKTVADELSTKMTSELESCDNQWQARIKAQKITSGTNKEGLSGLARSIVQSSPKWKNIPDLDSSKFSFKESHAHEGEFTVRMMGSTKDSCNQLSKYNNSVPINEATLLFVADTPSSCIQKTIKLRNELNCKHGRKHTILLARAKTAAVRNDFSTHINKWIHSKDVEGIPLHKLSDVTYLNVSGGVGSSADSKAVATSVLKMAANWQYSKSERWLPDTADLASGTGVYVSLDRFRAHEYKASDGTYNHAINYYNKVDSEKHHLWEKVAILRSFKAYEDIQVYGFKPRIHDKLGPGWVEFQKYYKDTLPVAVAGATELIANFIKYKAMQMWLGYTSSFTSPLLDRKDEFDNKNNPLIAYLSYIKSLSDFKDKVLDSELARRFRYVEKELLATLGAEKTDKMLSNDSFEKIKQRYPLLTYGNLIMVSDKATLDEVIRYCNLMDGQNA